MRKTLLALALLAATPAAAAEPATLPRNVPFCADLRDAQRLPGLQKDEVALNRFIQKLGCGALKAGTKLYRDEKNGKVSCLRFPGETMCLWAPLDPTTEALFDPVEDEDT